jgi:hypothetical protein
VPVTQGVHAAAVLPTVAWKVLTEQATQAPADMNQPAGHCGVTHMTVMPTQVVLQ